MEVSMEEKRIRLLNIEDEEVDHMALVRFAKVNSLPYDIERAATLAEALKLVREKVYDIIILDYVMPDGTGLGFLDKIKGTPSIFVTGSGDEIVAVSAMKGGVYDYIVKDPSGGYLYLIPAVIENALQRFRDEEMFTKNYEELEKMNRLMVNRELRMEELRKENAKLKARVEELEKGLNG